MPCAKRKMSWEGIDDMTSLIPIDRLKAAVDRVIREDFRGGDNAEDAHDFAARLLELEPWAEKAREALRKVEWAAFSGGYCPSCLGIESNGHAPDCALAELLREE